MGYKILSESLDNTFVFNELIEGAVISCINPHSFAVSENDPEFKVALKNASFLLCDGVGFFLALRLHGIIVPRVTGFDLFNYVLNNCKNSKATNLLFIGSTKHTLGKIKEKISSEHPNLIVNIYSPPFFNSDEMNDEQLPLIIAKYKPKIVFVGMTAPKQEKYVNRYQYLFKDMLVCNIGAVFDYYAGNIVRPPKIVTKLGFEWLFRLFQQPRKIFPRLFISPIKMILVLFLKDKNNFS